MPTPKIVVMGLLQNQWAHNPRRVEEMYASGRETHGDDRVRIEYVKYALFRGCKTGEMLRKHLGRKWCDDIVWENTSPRVAGQADVLFPIDYPHLEKRIEEVKPLVVIAFGNQAKKAVTLLQGSFYKIQCPHPAARIAGVAEALQAVKQSLDQISQTAGRA